MSNLFWQFIFKRIGVLMYFLIIIIIVAGAFYYSDKIFPMKVSNYSDYCHKQYMNLSGIYQTGYGVEINCTDSAGKIYLFELKNVSVLS